METSTLIIIVSSLLLFSSILAIVIYFVILQKKEEVTTPEEEDIFEQQAFIEQPTTAAPTAAPTTAAPITPPVITFPPLITPPPTTAAPYAIGQSIKCTSNDVGGGLNAIYRYDGNNTLRIYPNADIAKSWDPDYLNSKNIDCKDLKKGADMLQTGLVDDPDYTNVRQVVNTNYRNIANSCLTDAGGLCNELKYEDCYATMKSNGDFVIRKDADTAPTMVWNTKTQYLGVNSNAKFVLGNDGRFSVISDDVPYWVSSNSESTNGPFVARLEKSDGNCALSIYDTDNNRLYRTL